MKYLRFKLRQIRNIATNFRYIPFFFQRRFKNPQTRQKVAQWVAKRRPPKSLGQFLNTNVSGLLAENGISHLGPLLTEQEIREIREHLELCYVADAYRPEISPFLPLGADRHDSTHVAFHRTEDLIAAPHLLALANRPEILAVAEAFLGCKPTIGLFTSWWSYATGEDALAAERFHRDVDDWRFLKLFVYLSDVGKAQGPHIYVQASAEVDRLLDVRRFEDAEVEGLFGNNAILVNTGQSGEAFFENTFGIHKGQPVDEGHRVIFQVVYCLSPLPYAPRKPLGSLAEARTRTGMNLDPYVNRLYLDNKR